MTVDPRRAVEILREIFGNPRSACPAGETELAVTLGALAIEAMEEWWRDEYSVQWTENLRAYLAAAHPEGKHET